mmetsp:Transcript_68512/g.198769  ORF Transcript_68512/g.198769 Transcript_68512/m.198769 type:complete len:807 (+) Transcript_68512:74-2494(+)
METGACTSGAAPDVSCDRELRSCDTAEYDTESSEELDSDDANDGDHFDFSAEASTMNGWSPTLHKSRHMTYQEWADATRKAPATESESFCVSTTMQSRTTGDAPLNHKLCTWSMLALIGSATGLLAVCVDKGLEVVYELRMTLNERVVESWSDSGVVGLLVQYASFSAACMFLASMAGALVCFAAPLAAGSGIPEIKCYLNGVLLRRVVTKKTLVAKAVGIVFSVAAGLPVGKEGPMIHSGSVVGGLGCRMLANIVNRFGMEHPLALARERRDFVAAGATAGVAAAFGSPMGACLFAIEEGSSYMNPGILLKLFVASCTAAFVSRFFASLALHSSSNIFVRMQAGNMGTVVPVFLERFERMEYTVWEFPMFIIMGVLGGLCGALFCFCNKKLTQQRKKWMQAPKFGKKGKVIVGKNDFFRFLEVLFVTFLLSSVFFWVPISQHGKPVSIHDLSGTEKLFWSTGTASLRSLLHSPREEDFDMGMLIIFFCIHMTATCLTYGLSVPSGLFVPSLLGGAAMGRIIGQTLEPYVTADPGIYALVGATAMLSGAARITISLAMILMEVTGNSQFSLPIFAAAMFARWTGNYFGRGIYDLHIIELKRVPLLEHDPEKELLHIPAREIMASDVLGFAEVEFAQHLHRKLQSSTHYGFPILRHSRAVGYITRDALHFLLNSGHAHGIFDHEPKVATWNTMMRQLARKRPGLEPLSSAALGKRIDLRPYMTKDFHTMSENASAFSCYMLFRQLGLRHLFLNNCEGEITGIITRKDLIMMDDLSKEETAEVSPQQGDERDGLMVSSTSSLAAGYQG